VWIATPSLYETFIHNTLPAFTGASELLNFEPEPAYAFELLTDAFYGFLS
jgi:hypothetical protein